MANPPDSNRATPDRPRAATSGPLGPVTPTGPVTPVTPTGPVTPGPVTRTGPATAGTRTLPPAVAGPVIKRSHKKQAREGVVTPTPPRPGTRAYEREQRRQARATGAPVPPVPSADKPRGRSNAAKLHQFHAQAAKRLGMPELAISGEEAADLAAAMDQLADLTGWQPTGPLFGWIGIMWTFASIYGGRMMDIAARRRVAGTAAARSPTVPPAAAPPPIPPAPAPTIKPAPPVPPAPRSATAARWPVNGLDVNTGGVAGITPAVPGVPITTEEERQDRL